MLNTSVIDRMIGSRVSYQRSRRGLDRAALARRIGVAEQTLSDFESGFRRIDPLIMMNICHSLNVGVAYFFEPWAVGWDPDAPKARGSHAARVSNPSGSRFKH